MDGQGATSATQRRNRDALKTPNLTKPPETTLAVSAAAMFKRQKLDSPQTWSSSRSPRKSTTKKSSKRKQEEKVHDLALSFKETSEEYRRHLYSTAVARINQDHNTLLNKLHGSNLQIASSDPVNSGSQASPLKLTVPVKYQRLVEKLCNPLSSYRYGLQRRNATGEMERIQTTLHVRFHSFEKHTHAEMHQIKELQEQWESVMAEIFQLGVICLGEGVVAALLCTAKADANASSPASKAEPTLFVSEHGSPAQEGRRKRRRVSFRGTDVMSLFPGFLHQASKLPRPSTPIAPETPHEEIHQFEGEIAGLGKQHVADLQRLEKEAQKWWLRKQTQLAHTFMQD
ncbi:hypothetical protein EKO04_008358 [Ascochyta lentis]|uniref:Uncharacterized protein n=1 Tax=Ascochyta lentis TaxID=205686 RepID=A0A8H7IXP1_9PLEO|nr:hypothetical protein EKO04_008358 [Ascochyta lentis]